MKTRQGPDALLLLATFLLLGIGLVMVYSSSSVWSLYKFDISYYYLRRQAIFAALGLVAMFLPNHICVRKATEKVEHILEQLAVAKHIQCSF